MSGVFLNGGLDRPLCEAVIASKTPDVGDARVAGYLLRRATRREWNQRKKKKCAAVNNAGVRGLVSTLMSDMEM